MSKNTGKPAEADFEAHFARMGKRAFCQPLVDASDLYGANDKRILNVPAQPADYVVICDGEMFYAEVKSSTDRSAFRFSLIRKTQWAAAKRTIAAGGKYYVFIKSLVLNRWYRVPALAIRTIKDSGLESARWDQLHPFAWECNGL